MFFPSMRPTFREELDVPASAVAEAVRAALARAPDRVVGSVAGNVIELYPPREERRVWSPRLSVVIYPRGRTVVVGRYGPSPDLWTFLVALYALCWFAVVGGPMWGLAQHLTQEPATGLWGVPLGLAGMVLIYVAALVGRNAAREQVAVLARFFEACVAASAHSHREEVGEGSRS